MKQKGFSKIIVVLMSLTLFVVAGWGYWYFANNNKTAQNSGRSNKGSATVSALYPNLSKNEVLVGDSHNIFVGKVIKAAGTVSGKGGDKLSYKQFEVKVLLNIKGDLNGLVLVDIAGFGNRIVSYSTNLGVGATYLMATRYHQQYDSHTLIEESHGWKLLSGNNTLSDSELIDLAQKDARVNELRIAYPNEIVREGEIRAGVARNRFLSLPQEKQDQLKAEADELKAWWQW